MNVYDVIDAEYGKVHDNAIDVRNGLLSELEISETYNDHVRADKIYFLIECINKIIYAANDLTDTAKELK